MDIVAIAMLLGIDEESEDEIEIAVKPSNETVSSIVCTAKIPNFFTVPKYQKDFNIYSSPFRFADTVWRFKFSGERESSEPSKREYFDVSMLRLSAEIPGQNIYILVSLVDADGKECLGMNQDGLCDFSDGSTRVGFFFDSPQLSYDARNILRLMVHLISERREVESNQAPTILPKGIFLNQDLKDALLNGQNYNVVFNVQGKELKAHRYMLAARSDVFHSIFSHDHDVPLPDKNNEVINVPDCDPEAFEQFLLYVYTGEIKELSEKNMFELYYVADKYSCMQLKGECSAFIKNSFSVTNIRHAVELAAKHDDAGLMDYAMSYFTNNADAIWPTDEWQLFVKENYVVANQFISKSLKKAQDEKAKNFPMF